MAKEIKAQSLAQISFEIGQIYEIKFLPETEDEETGFIPIEYIQTLAANKEEFERLYKWYEDYEIIPIKEKEIYAAYLKDIAQSFQFIGKSGLTMKILGEKIDANILENSNAMTIIETLNYQQGAKVIGFENEDITKLYFYIPIIRREYFDFCSPGILLMQKANFIRMKLRRRYAIFILHLTKFMKILDIKPLILHILALAANITSLEVNLIDLYKLGLFIFDLIPELNECIAENPEAMLVFQELLNMDFYNIIHNPRQDYRYIDLIYNGTNFLANWSDHRRLYWIVNTEWIHIAEYPTNLIDYFSYNFNRYGRRKQIDDENLEKLICTILFKDLNKAIWYLTDKSFIGNLILDDIRAIPPINLYKLVYNFEEPTYYTMEDVPGNAFWINRNIISLKYNLKT